MPDDRDAATFDCIECGRHILVIAGPSDPCLCAACLFVPGWFRDERLRAFIDRTHDGREPAIEAEG